MRMRKRSLNHRDAMFTLHQSFWQLLCWLTDWLFLTVTHTHTQSHTHTHTHAQTHTHTHTHSQPATQATRLSHTPHTHPTHTPPVYGPPHPNSQQKIKIRTVCFPR